MALIPSVVPLEIIESAWGNAVRDTGCTVFSTMAERSAQLPVPTDGRLCFTADDDQLWVGRAGAWRQVAHHLSRYGMQIGGVILGGQPSGFEGGELTLLAGPSSGGAPWHIDNYNAGTTPSLRFFIDAARQPLQLTGTMIHALARVQFYAEGFDTTAVGMKRARIVMPDNVPFEVRSTTMGDMLTVKSTGTPTEGIRANVTMNVPTLTTGNIVTITPGGQIGRSARSINSLDTFEERITSLEARTGAVGAGSIETRLTDLEGRMNALEARVAALEAA